MTDASGVSGVKKKQERPSRLTKTIFEALRTRAPRRSRKWFSYRRALLRGALAQDGYRVEDFANKLHVTHTHLNFVLRGQRPSARIDHSAYLLIAFVYGDRIGSRYAKTEPKDVIKWAA